MGEIEISGHDSTLVDAFTQGLRDAAPDTAAHRCYEKLCGKRPDDLTEMMLKVKQYTTGEARLRLQDTRGKRVSVAEEPRKRRHDEPTHSAVVPLNQELSRILPIYEAMPEFESAWPIRYNRPPDTRQFCLYHKQHGHDTDRCFSIRDKINKLVLEGKLGQFRKDHDATQHNSNHISYTPGRKPDVVGVYEEPGEEDRRAGSRNRIHTIGASRAADRRPGSIFEDPEWRGPE